MDNNLNDDSNLDDLSDYEVDDILKNRDKRKKRKNSKIKGKRGELGLVKILNERFETLEFSRVLGSGNRWSQVSFVKNDYVGDLVTPSNFVFSLECKNGYEDIDLNNIFVRGDRQLDTFLDQALKDAKRVKKSPLLCWKKNRQPWVAAVKQADIQDHLDDFSFILFYKEWCFVALDILLSLPNSFFFRKN